MAPYEDPAKSSLDLLTLSHNAFRRELLDVYELLAYFELAGETALHAEAVRFFDHWEVFKGFAFTMLDMEQAVLFPALQAAHISLPRPLAEEPRAAASSSFRDLLSTVSAQKSALLSDAVLRVEMGASLKACVDAIAARATSYFSMQTQLLNTALSTSHAINAIPPKRRAEIMKEITAYFLKAKPDGTLYVVMLSQWLSGTRSRAAVKSNAVNMAAVQSWRYDNLSAAQYPRYAVWEKKYFASMQDDVRFFKSRRAALEARNVRAVSKAQRDMSRAASRNVSKHGSAPYSRTNSNDAVPFSRNASSNSNYSNSIGARAQSQPASSASSATKPNVNHSSSSSITADHLRNLTIHSPHAHR